jgi:hypothetical protein
MGTSGSGKRHRWFKRTSTVLIALLLASMVTIASANHNGLHIADLTDVTLDEEDLVELVLGPDITAAPANVVYTGHDQAAGTFSGGTGIIGFEDGIILSSGKVTDAVGPNSSPATSTNFGNPGDADLTALVGASTYDAAVLEFDFEVPADAETLFFQYVFGSEEYNEWVDSEYNDVFAFYVNGVNCAVTQDGDPVSVNTINNNVNSNLYINNDPFHGGVAVGDLLDTEMDGFTVVLTCQAEINPGETNSVKLAIADTTDHILDSWVFIKAGSFTFTDPEPTELCVDLVAGQYSVVGDVCVIDDGENLTVTYHLSDDAIAAGWLLTETHLHAGNKLSDFPRNPAGNPQVGHFANKAAHDPGVTEYSYVIPIGDLEGDILIGAHADMSNTDLEATEGAWGDGDLFGAQGNWAMYFTYMVGGE